MLCEGIFSTIKKCNQRIILWSDSDVSIPEMTSSHARRLAACFHHLTSLNILLSIDGDLFFKTTIVIIDVRNGAFYLEVLFMASMEGY